MAETKNNAGKSLRAKALELWSRVVVFDKKLKVYKNGDDNQYPTEIERVVANSPTAKRSAGMLAKFVAGSGVVDDKVVNKKTRQTKAGLVRRIATDISVQYGCFIHLGVEIDDSGRLTHANPKVLDYTKCRISEEDDGNNAGVIYYRDYSNDTGSKVTRTTKKKEKWYYPFSSNQSVITAQIQRDAKEAKLSSDAELKDLISKYRGQVFYLNLTPQFIYAVSLFDSVYNDCDTEYRMSLYTNGITRSGFLGKVAVVTVGLDKEDEEQVDADVKSWLGAEEANSVWRINLKEGVDPDKAVKIQTVKSQFDEKQFTETRKNCRINIMGAANNIPEALIYNSNSLIGNSGENFKEAKEMYQEQTEGERMAIEQTLLQIGIPCTIIPLAEIDEVTEGEADQETKKAQATLRGTVGGVDGILRIQQSVSQQLTDFESAVTILMEIYGFTREVSEALLGKPQIKEDEGLTVLKLTEEYGIKKKRAKKLIKNINPIAA